MRELVVGGGYIVCFRCGCVFVVLMGIVLSLEGGRVCLGDC